MVVVLLIARHPESCFRSSESEWNWDRRKYDQSSASSVVGPFASGRNSDISSVASGIVRTRSVRRSTSASASLVRTNVSHSDMNPTSTACGRDELHSSQAVCLFTESSASKAVL